MKNCPTCGQPILPSMGERPLRNARQVLKRVGPTKTLTLPEDDDQKHNTKNQNVNKPEPILGSGLPILSVTIDNTTIALKTEATPRGCRGRGTIKQRYRIHLRLINQFIKGTITGQFTVVNLHTLASQKDGHTPEKEKTIHQLEPLPLPKDSEPVEWVVNHGNNTFIIKGLMVS